MNELHLCIVLCSALLYLYITGFCFHFLTVTASELNWFNEMIFSKKQKIKNKYIFEITAIIMSINVTKKENVTDEN